MTNAERQRKWMMTHRALHNLRRREYRKMISESRSRGVLDGVGCDAKPEKSKTLEALRELIANEQEKPVEANVVPLVYRDDYGRVISERQWKTLEKKKADAREGGYVIDEYAQ